jgi:hypothetical protein
MTFSELHAAAILLAVSSSLTAACPPHSLVTLSRLPRLSGVGNHLATPRLHCITVIIAKTRDFP